MPAAAESSSVRQLVTPMSGKMEALEELLEGSLYEIRKHDVYSENYEET